MEQTLGKRIMENRKRLGMTQDQLAEKLGITAQAVSKWENDLSCPDIATIPKLAEIFGVSTDVLLGVEKEPEVHEAEVEDTPASFKGNTNGWQFHWDSGKRGAVGFAVMVLAVGLLYLITEIFFQTRDISFWNILWPTALTVYGIWGLWPRFSFFRLGCALLGGYFIVSKIGGIQFVVSPSVIIAIAILFFGISLLLDALRRPKRPFFSFGYQDHEKKKDTKSDYTSTDNSFTYSGSFGDIHQHVGLTHLERGSINTSFGDFTLDMSQLQSVSENATVEANCSFGEITILVPRKFFVELRNSTSFASVDVDGEPDPQPQGVIRLFASASFGQITVEYV